MARHRKSKASTARHSRVPPPASISALPPAHPPTASRPDLQPSVVVQPDTPSLPSEAPPPKRRGAKASTYVFSHAQLAHLDSLTPEFESEVLRVNPGLKPHNNDLTKWKKAASHAVMELELFKPLITPSRPVKDWEEAIQHRFTNYYNNTLKRRLQGQKENLLQDVANVVEADAAPLPSKPVGNTLARAMVMFSSELPTREIFAFHNPDVLKAKESEVKKVQPKLVGGTLRTVALSQLFESGEADIKEWEAKAAAMRADIDGNQQEFPLLMSQAIDKVLCKGVLGPVITSFNYAFRNSQGGVEYGTIYNGYNTQSEERINWRFEDHDAKVSAWMTVADCILPRPPTAKRTRPPIPVNDDGIPILTEFDSMSATGKQIADVLSDYFAALWEHSRPQSRVIPWTDITATPEKFFDATRFKFPLVLKDPSTYTQVTDLHSLVNYLIKCSSSSTPFQFVSLESSPTIVATKPPGPPKDTNPFLPGPSLNVIASAPAAHTDTNPSALSSTPAPSPPQYVSDTHPEADTCTSGLALATSVSTGGNIHGPSDGFAKLPNDKKKTKKTKAEKKSETHKGVTSAPPSRKSNRVVEKRKASEVDTEGGRPTKKKKHYWFNIVKDDEGNCYNESTGEPCDDKGNPL